MKLLALDQASRTTGWAIYENDKLLNYGKFTYDDDDFGVRLYHIRSKIESMIKDNSIDELIFEDIQFQSNVGNNVDTFKKLAEVYGVLSELAAEMKIPYRSVISTVWKSSLGIKGKDRAAQKKAAQNWVVTKYNVSPTQDESDAICIGYYGTAGTKDIVNPNDWTK